MVSSIKPLQRPLALGDQVYQTLRAHLRDGTIVSGQPLQEVQLAEKLGVSRTPVREALTRLASEGVRRVAELTTEATVRAPLDEALADAIAAYKAEDADAFREANIRFRNTWKDLVPNRRLVKAIEQYADHMMRIRALTLGDPKIRNIVLKGLKRIAEALAAGDGEAAAEAMRDHLGEAKRCFIAATGLDQPATNY